LLLLQENMFKLLLRVDLIGIALLIWFERRGGREGGRKEGREAGRDGSMGCVLMSV